ncbi:MAG: putative Fanconi anemia group J protein, partial [Streblomastix strix]
DFITVRHVGFWCFDASIAMNEIIGLKPQSIVITSGTLSPLSGFAYELGLSLPLVHQNRHVVDASQVWVSVISRGAQGGTMNFSYAHRKKMKDLQYGQKGKQFNQSSYYGSSYSGDGLSSNLNLLDELGITIVDIASCVTNGGILVFFPSYELMEECMREWSTPRPRNEQQQQQQQQQSSSYNHNNSNIQQSWNTPNKPISNQKAIVQILREQGKLLMCEPRLASQLGRVIEQYRNVTRDQTSDLDSNSESGITDLGFGVGNSGSKSGKVNQNPKMSVSEFGNEITGFGQVSNSGSGKGFKIGGDIGITNNQTISNHQSSYHQSTPYTKQTTSPSSNSSNQHKQSFQTSSSSSSSYQQPQFTGAVLLGVCRGKLSEGIDFSDSAARVVIMVGVPFQNTHDPKVKLKMQYMNERKDKINRVKTKQSNSLNTNTNNSLQQQIIQQNLPQANSQKQTTKPTQSSAEYILDGSLWYHMQAIRAVNQSIGRVIRHKKDYGAIVLIDERYLEQDNLVKLSSWVQESLHGGWWLIECERIRLKEKQREKEKKQEIEYQKDKEKEMKRLEMKMELDSDVITEFEEFETKQERDNILSILNFDQQTPQQVSPIHQYKQNKPSSQQKSLQSTQSSSQQNTSFQLPFQINQLLPSSSFTYFELITSLRRFFNETPKLLNMMQTTLPFSFQPIPQISNDDQNSLWKPFSDYQFAPPFIIGPDDEKEMKLVMELVEKKKI